ncbi:hypothetical protein [Halomicrobium salinisoli]|uniref:hypothetical protein n=1 Tax=Halomicrobium salinisoli TaxID=2878391 RepID=UPI001CF06D14|nr:hypothetical protein [Halomicrobium salinisoli]
MAITSDDETRQTNEAVVSVRVPDGADGDLATEAERRLSRADGVSDASVEGLRGPDPGLSATVVTVDVTVETTAGGRSRVGVALDEITGVEVLEAVPA